MRVKRSVSPHAFRTVRQRTDLAFICMDTQFVLHDTHRACAKQPCQTAVISCFDHLNPMPA